MNRLDKILVDITTTETTLKSEKIYQRFIEAKEKLHHGLDNLSKTLEQLDERQIRHLTKLK